MKRLRAASLAAASAALRMAPYSRSAQDPPYIYSNLNGSGKPSFSAPKMQFEDRETLEGLLDSLFNSFDCDESGASTGAGRIN
jgi:hypothetical protein